MTLITNKRHEWQRLLCIQMRDSLSIYFGSENPESTEAAGTDY
jgi:hypothetical protein